MFRDWSISIVGRGGGAGGGARAEEGCMVHHVLTTKEGYSVAFSAELLLFHWALKHTSLSQLMIVCLVYRL